ncbi:hypothetical protein V1281_002731 [Nitrobacteraceae bacterium AZCC 2161]
MKSMPDASECRRLAEQILQQAQKLPLGPERKSLETMASEYEEEARASDWRCSSLHAPI